MPDVSIAIAATDRYSSTIKTIQSVTRAFSKDAESLQQKLSALDKTKATLKVDTDQARKRLGLKIQEGKPPESTILTVYRFGGEDGIRTHGSFRNHWFSRPAP